MRASVVPVAIVAAACSQYTAKATVTVAVSGPGSVRGTALQGDCRGTCWFSVDRQTPVHLEPVPQGAATFAGWSGACSGTGACDLTPGADVSVAATFREPPPPQPRHLHVSLNGAGAVRSDPAGIDCPQTCEADFPDGAAVRLDATASGGWDFTGFGGACSGSSCALTLSSDMSALATFLQRPVTLSVQITGSGSVMSNPAGIDCPRNCSAQFSSGTPVSLSASAAPAFVFSGFDGGCRGATCSLRLGADAQVSAAFKAIPSFNLTVVTGGDGGGRVVSTPPGIDCPGSCTATFLEGTALALSAQPDVLSKAGRFSGTCNGPDCSFTIKADSAVGLQFALRRYVAIDLGAAPGDWFVEPQGMSPNGTFVVGTSGGWPSHAFLWNGKTMALEGLVATAVNDAGVVAGNIGGGPVFRWKDGDATLLPDLGGASFTSGINRSGIIVGYSTRTDSVQRAVYWDATGIVDLGSLGSAWNACSRAFGINSGGLIVGQSCVDAGGLHAVRFRGPGEIDDLGTLGGGSAVAQAINDAGVIVGLSTLPNGQMRGFVYTAGKMTDAGALPGTTFSQLIAINAAGVAVGVSGESGNRGVVYGDGRMVDLNALVDGSPYRITRAVAIDDAGNILAQGDASATLRAVILRRR